MPPFAMAGQTEFDAQVFEHLDGDFAGEGAVFFGVDVLRTQQHFAAGDGLADGVQIDERRGDADVHAGV